MGCLLLCVPVLSLSTFIVCLRHDTPSHQQKDGKNSVAHLLVCKMFPSLSLFPYYILVIWQHFCCALWCQIFSLAASWICWCVLYWNIKFVCVFQVACFPFDDHNCPPIQLVISFCHSAYSWLKEDIENVVVVHCKAGKARTGLMISSLLLFLKVKLPCTVYQSEW